MEVSLLGQALEAPGTLLGLVIALAMGMGGLLGWLLRHLFTVTLPKMQEVFANEMRLERENCQKQFEATLGRIDQTLGWIRQNQEEYRHNQQEWRERWQKMHGTS